MERVMIQIPASLKAKLDGLRNQGYTASGVIRFLLEQHFQTAGGKKEKKEQRRAPR
jgi:metal-responsive CopG/Arc/MetJ family transcriptional regulator